MNRRKFVETSGVAAGATLLNRMNPSANQIIPAVPEQKSQKAAKIKLGLYSISYGGIWYKGTAL